MIVLPKKPEKAELTSFLISFGILFSVTISLVSGMLTGYVLMAGVSGIAVIAVLVTAELIKPGLLSPLYSIWNRAAQIYAGMLHDWVSRLCFFIIFTATGRFGKRDAFKPHRAGASSWSFKQTLETETYNIQSDKKNLRKDQNRSWAGNFIYSNAVRRNKWLVCLLPHLVLLRISSIKRDQKKQEDIYTLY